jgi:hypothetical protein
MTAVTPPPFTEARGQLAAKSIAASLGQLLWLTESNFHRTMHVELDESCR